MKIEITFKSGAQVVADVESFETSMNFAGGFNKLSWITPAGWTRKLVRVDMDEVAAIVAIFEAGITPVDESREVDSSDDHS
jgi:hypothetical protein